MKKSLAFILADGFQLLARPGNSIPLMLRYQAQLERLYRRAVEEFEPGSCGRELPNEPKFTDDEPTEAEGKHRLDSVFSERTHFYARSSPC